MLPTNYFLSFDKFLLRVFCNVFEIFFVMFLRFFSCSFRVRSRQILTSALEAVMTIILLFRARYVGRIMRLVRPSVCLSVRLTRTGS